MRIILRLNTWRMALCNAIWTLLFRATRSIKAAPQIFRKVISSLHLLNGWLLRLNSRNERGVAKPILGDINSNYNDELWGLWKRPMREVNKAVGLLILLLQNLLSYTDSSSPTWPVTMVISLNKRDYVGGTPPQSPPKLLVCVLPPPPPVLTKDSR